MSPTRNQILAVVVVLALAVASVGIYFALKDDDNDNDGVYPEGSVQVTTPVDYNGNTAVQTYTEIPERVVAGCNTALNILLKFGLGDRIIGIYYMEEEVWEEVADEYQKVVSRIGEDRVLPGNISQAVLTDWEPDCIIGWVAFEDGKLGSPEYWNALNCNVWALNTMVKDRTIEGMTKDYDNIGKVFDVKDKTDAFMQSFTEKVTSLTGVLSDSEETVAVFDGCYINDGRYWFYGKTTFIGYLLTNMGANLAFENGGNNIPAATVYDTVEDITILFFVCYGSVTFDNTLAFWEGNATLSTTPAIVDGNVMPMKLSVAYGADPSLMDVLDYLTDLLS